MSSASIRPAPNGGWGWVVTASCLFVLGQTNGLMLSMSVMYVSWLEEFGQSRGQTSWVLSIVFAAMYGCGPVAASLASRIGFRATVVLGGLLTGSGLILSYWATSVTYLVVTIGVISGIGCCFCYLCSIAVVSAYFTTRLPIAMGIATAGVGIGAFGAAPLLNYLIEIYGWRGALLIVGAISLHICLFGMLLRPIMVEREASETPDKFDTVSSVCLENEIEIEEINGETTSMIRNQSCDHDCGIKLTVTDADSIENENGEHSCNLVIKHSSIAEIDTTNVSSRFGDQPAIHNKHLDIDTGTHRRVHAKGRSMEACLNASSKDKQSALFPFSSHKELRKIESGEVVHKQKWTLKKDISLDALYAKSLKHLNALYLLASVNNVRGSKEDLLLEHTFDEKTEEENGVTTNMVCSKENVNNPTTTTTTSIITDTANSNTNTINNTNRTWTTRCLNVIKTIVQTYLEILKDPTFCMYAVSNFITNLSYFTPVMYMVDRAIDEGLTKQMGAVLISINGVGSILGRLFFGLVTYRLFQDRLMTYLVVLAMAGISTSLSVLCGGSVLLHSLYAFVLGALMGGYSCLCAIVTVDIMGPEKGTESFGLLLGFMGVAGLMGPPFGGFLFDLTQTYRLTYIINGIFLVFSMSIMVPTAFIRRRERRRGRKGRDSVVKS